MLRHAVARSFYALAIGLSAAAHGAAIPIVGDRAALAEAMAAMEDSKVDFVGIGDSNQILGGTGWDDGFQYGLSQRSTMYATGLISGKENQGNGAGAGFNYNYGNFNNGAFTGAPAELANFFTNLGPANYFLGGRDPAVTEQDILEAFTGGIDVTKPLTYRAAYGTWVGGDHTLNLSVRALQNGAYQVIANQVVNATTGAYGISHLDVNIPANATRTFAGGLADAQDGAGPATSNAFILFDRFLRSDLNAGFSYSTAAYYGGQPSKTVANALVAASTASLTQYFGELRNDQGSGAKHIVITINEGFNDRNDTTDSVGPSPAPGNTGAGYEDNLRAIVQRIQAVWTANGWDKKELYFVFMPSHPDQADDADLAAFRDAAKDLAGEIPQSVMVDLNALTSEEELSAKSWYLDGSTPGPHLNTAGYEALGLRVVDALSTVPEPGSTGLLAAAAALGLLSRRKRAAKISV